MNTRGPKTRPACSATRLKRMLSPMSDPVSSLRAVLKYFPAFSVVLLGLDGSVWVRRHLTRGGAHRWDVFGADLRPAGSVFLDASFEVKSVSMAAVYGIELAEFDVPWIVRYDITK